MAHLLTSQSSPAHAGERSAAAKEIVEVTARCALGLIFLIAASSKIAQPYEFLSAVYQYGILGPKLGYGVAWFLPWLELTTGCALLLGVLQQGAAWAACGLGVLFVSVKAMTIHQSRPIGCGCVVGSANGIVGLEDLTLAVCVFALAVVVLVLGHGSSETAEDGTAS
jgi:uncharacterized membrane protein YphA (DoxX/SURF4 family)